MKQIDGRRRSAFFFSSLYFPLSFFKNIFFLAVKTRRVETAGARAAHSEFTARHGICISEFAFFTNHCLDHCLTLCGAMPDGSTTDDRASSYQNTVEYFRSVVQSRLLLNKHSRAELAVVARQIAQELLNP